MVIFCFFKQKTAYGLRMSDWSSDVCSSDLHPTDVLRAVDNAPAPEGLDVRAFAGRFEGTLPCADCPGIDSALELGADGTYSLHDAYRESDGATNDVTGTWTVEEAGKRIRLDPNSKQAQDRLYEVVSDDELRMLEIGRAH